jgi:hypothetical protein
VSTTARERAKWERQRKQVRLLADLIWRDDVEEPTALADDDREAIQVVLRIALESNDAFGKVLRQKGPVWRTDELDHLCDSIRAGIDFFAVVKQTANCIRDVTPPHTTGSLRQMMLQHRKCLAPLRDPKLSLPKRLSLLLVMIRIELIVFGHLW